MENKVINLLDVKEDKEVKHFIERTDSHLKEMGYTEHGVRHAHIVSKFSRTLLVDLKRSQRECELAGIAGYMHDIGNFMGREGHGVSGALLTFNILQRMKMPIEDIAFIMGAIGNHEEERGTPSHIISAAVILGDKADVHRSRVRNTDYIALDIHDRVNYAAERSTLLADYNKKMVCMSITIDTNISQVMEYFEIFLSRMVICRHAANMLGCEFELKINDTKLC